PVAAAPHPPPALVRAAGRMGDGGVPRPAILARGSPHGGVQLPRSPWPTPVVSRPPPGTLCYLPVGCGRRVQGPSWPPSPRQTEGLSMAGFSLHLTDEQIQLRDWVHGFARDVLR